MVTEEIRQLQERVSRLEHEVHALNPTSSTYVAAAAPVTVPPAPPPVPSRAAAPPPIKRGDEVSIVGAWMARAGALAVLVGGAFAFKYAIDRGLLGPGTRVIIGLLVGSFFLAAGEWARRRDWPGWAQAVTGGAIGIWYLSIWSGHQLYGLIDAPVALAGYAAIGVTCAMLAIRNRSEALAILSVFGAFLNPMLVGTLRPAEVLAYVLIVDLSVFFLATQRGWHNLERLALIGTWLWVAVASLDAPLLVFMGFATGFLALFGWRILRDEDPQQDDPQFLGMNSLFFAALGLAEVGAHAPDWQGAFAATVGAAHLAAAFALSKKPELRQVLGVLGGGLLVIAVPLQFEGPAIPAVWTVQALVLLTLGRQSGSPIRTTAGLGLLGLAILDVLVFEFALGSGYSPERLLLSGDSALMALEIAAVAAAAQLVGRSSQIRAPLMIAGHALALIWLTWETQAFFQPAVTVFPPVEGAGQVAAFATTMVWAAYAGALLAAGVALRSRNQRFLAVGLFGAVVVKLVLHDLWLLQPLYRTIAFFALGLTLLAGSLVYHRFRDLVLGGGEG
jgi:uncharacterized membrane protein